MSICYFGGYYLGGMRSVGIWTTGVSRALDFSASGFEGLTRIRVVFRDLRL